MQSPKSCDPKSKIRMASQNQSDLQTSGLPHEVRHARLHYHLDFAERNVSAALAAAAVTSCWCGHYYDSLSLQKTIMAVLRVRGNVYILIGQSATAQSECCMTMLQRQADKDATKRLNYSTGL